MAGHRDSYTWRSISSSFSLLQKGLEWRVGAGNQIRIWEDRWVPGLADGSPKYTYPGTDNYQWVSELLSDDGLSWNEHLLRSICTEEDCDKIRSIALSTRRPNDLIRWSFTINKEYTVRSGYRLDFDTWLGTREPNFRRGVSSSMWQKCWSLDCPPRIKTVIWRILDNNLSVRGNLRARGMDIDDQCPGCGEDTETVVHLFFNCVWARSIWNEVGVDLGSDTLQNTEDGLSMLFATPDRIEWGRRAACIWAIWKMRNLLVFQPGTNWSRQQILADGFRFWREFIDVHESARDTAKPIYLTQWQRPPNGWLKVNVDAGVRLPGGGQVGVVVRDDMGNFVMAATRTFPNLHHPTILEGKAIFTGLEFAGVLGLERIIMESDCLPLVSQCSKASSDRSDIAMIVDDCKSLSALFQQVQFSYVRREANYAAHEMAKVAIPMNRDLLVFSWPPDCLLDILHKEGSTAEV